MKKAKSVGTLGQHQSVALAKGLMWILEVKSRLMLILTACTLVMGRTSLSIVDPSEKFEPITLSLKSNRARVPLKMWSSSRA